MRPKRATRPYLHAVTAKLLALMLAGCGGDLRTSEIQQGLFDYGDTPLRLSWMKASHNTYETRADSPDDSITWHFGNTTNHIELDLRDTHAAGNFFGDWVIAHDFDSEPTQKCTTMDSDGYTFEQCLRAISEYHNANPGHPLISVILDKKQNWESMEEGSSQRSPWQLDNLIGWYLAPEDLFRPIDMAGTGTLRDRARADNWPTHNDVSGKIMFIMTSDSDCVGADRLEAYATDRQWAATAFIMPHANWLGEVEEPECFDEQSTSWVGMYNFDWVDDDPADGECDGFGCFYLPVAHDMGFLTRAYDIDDDAESDAASGRPFKQSDYGHANWIPVDCPWQQGGPCGYGNWPDGIYPE